MTDDPEKNEPEGRTLTSEDLHNPTDCHDDGINVPYGRIPPKTLRRMIEEFVTRDGADWAEAGGSLDVKVNDVMRQLREKKVKVVFDLTSQTANIVVCR